MTYKEKVNIVFLNLAFFVGMLIGTGLTIWIRG